MAYGIVHQFPGGTQEQYEASIAAVHPSDGSLPEGQIFHAAGPSADGWTIIAIHDSQESWERFRDEMLMPTMSEGIEGGFPTPPQETSFTVHNQQTGKRRLPLVGRRSSLRVTVRVGPGDDQCPTLFPWSASLQGRSPLTSATFI